jgi:hypothetical protein
MHDIFISYSREDSAFGKKIHQSLSLSGLKPWIDWIDIPSSSDWWQEIRQGIEAAAAFIFIISPDSVASPVCHLEIAHARLHNKRIIPVLFRETDEKKAFEQIEENKLGIYLETLIKREEIISLAKTNFIALAQINWILFTDPANYETQLQKLVNATGTDLEYVKSHTRLQVRAIEWEQGERREDFLLRGDDLAQAQELLLKDRNPLDPTPTELQIDYVEASSAYQEKQLTRRKRITNGIVAGILALLILPYLWLSARFYLDTSDSGGGLVVRAGDPGLKILPGFDNAAIGTDYTLSDIADPYVAEVMNEDVQGFWIPAKTWGDKLYPLLEPAQSGLAYWRTGEKTQAIAILSDAVQTGDEESIKTLAYLALLNPPEVDAILDVLLPALGGDEDTRQTGLQALQYLRQVNPELASSQAERLAQATFSNANMHIWAIEASGILAADPNKALGSILNKVDEKQVDITTPSVTALAALLGSKEQVEAILLDATISVFATLSLKDQQLIMPALIGQHLSTDQKEALQSILLQKLSSQSASEQILALQGLQALNLESREMLPAIKTFRNSPNETVREALPKLLIGLAEDEPETSFDILSILALSDPSQLIRYDALQAFPHWFEFDQQLVFDNLEKASGDPSDLVRSGALESLISLELETSCCLEGTERVLASKLDDEVFQVRWDAAWGLLLLSDQVQNPEALTQAALIISQVVESGEMHNYLGMWAGRYTSPEAVQVTGQVLLPHMQTADTFQIIDYISVFEQALEAQPQAIPSTSFLFSSLLPSQEIQGNVWSFIFQLHRQNPNFRSQTLEVFLEMLQTGDHGEMQNALEALGILGILDENTAVIVIDAIKPYQSSADLDVRAALYKTVGNIGYHYPDLIRDFLPGLLNCVKTDPQALQLVCSQALLDYASADELQETQITQDLFSLLSDTALDSEARIQIAKALVHLSDIAEPLSAQEGEYLIEQINVEPEEFTHLWLAGVLTAYHVQDFQQADNGISLLSEQAENTDSETREEAVKVLLLLGRQQPALGEKIITVMKAFTSDREYAVRALAIIAIREVALTDINNGRLGLESLTPALTSDQDNTRWEAVANGVSPILLAYPKLADQVVACLDLSYQQASHDTDSFSSLSQIQDTQIIAFRMLGEEQPEILWPLILSHSSYERSTGRAAMILVLKKRPEMIPHFDEKLASFEKGCQPHECLSVRLAREMILLLQNDGLMSILHKEESDNSFMNWLPSFIGVEPIGNISYTSWNEDAFR